MWKAFRSLISPAAPVDELQEPLPIDYARHPAFAPLITAEIREKGPKADRLHQDFVKELKRLAPEVDQGRSEGCVAAINRLFDRLKDLYPADPLFPAFCKAAATDTAAVVVETITFDHRKRMAAGAGVDRDDPLAATLIRDGVFSLRLDDDFIENINTALAEATATLMRRHQAGERGFMFESLVSPEGWGMLDRMLTETGVIRAASGYIGLPSRLTWAGQHLATHDQRAWRRNRYEREGLPMSPFQNLHKDLRPDTIKCMIYLKEVKPENGPFSYVPGSHIVSRHPVDFCMCRVIPGIHAGVPYDDMPEIFDDGTLFDSPTGRRHFLMLPKPLQYVSHLGEDVEAGSALADVIARRERVFTSDRGNMIVFDGCRGLHRGGLVREGSRLALQVGIKPP